MYMAVLYVVMKNTKATLYAAQASRVAKLELAPALLLFKKVLFLLY
jgi:hypothetical protein